MGRTLALVNVAYELAASGQKVLVVDFDLEAPGIHSATWRVSEEGPRHEGGRADSTHPGIVDYVGRFINTMRAPRAENHIIDATPTDCAGKIGLMPSGALNDDYGRRLSAINWNELYLKYDGYVMFEDLREQWRMLGYDYVLLDSRTGVTDVGGICTRHLPDAVVLMFRPDDQTIQGTAGVADAIRNERPAPGRDRVRLHFVMAAIPDVDDEDGILEDLRSRFRRRLNIPSDELLEIRNYQSMDLLRQPIYTDKRPRTQLARSYQELTRRMRSENIGDREGALEYLRRTYRDMENTRIIFGSGAVAGYYFGDDPFNYHAEMHDRLAEIAQRYADDPEVRFALACTYGRAGQTEHVARLLDRRSNATALSSGHLIERSNFLRTRFGVPKAPSTKGAIGSGSLLLRASRWGSSGKLRTTTDPSRQRTHRPISHRRRRSVLAWQRGATPERQTGVTSCAYWKPIVRRTGRGGTKTPKMGSNATYLVASAIGRRCRWSTGLEDDPITRTGA